jgi:hypothetical protein
VAGCDLILCDMVVSRIAATVMAAVALTACAGPNEQDLHQALKSAGCAMPESQYQQPPGRVVLSISVLGCRASDNRGGSRLLTASEATTLVATTAWAAATYRYDTLFVTDYNATNDDGSEQFRWSEEIPREALAARLGQRDSGMNMQPPESHLEDRAGASPWIVIPPLAAVLGLVLFVELVKAFRRRSISIIWIVR